jgi:hypothetical protein
MELLQIFLSGLASRSPTTGKPFIPSGFSRDRRKRVEPSCLSIRCNVPLMSTYRRTNVTPNDWPIMAASRTRDFLIYVNMCGHEFSSDLRGPFELLAVDQMHLVHANVARIRRSNLAWSSNSSTRACATYFFTQLASAAAAAAAAVAKDGTTDGSGSSSTGRPEWLDRALPPTNSDRIVRFVHLGIH